MTVPKDFKNHPLHRLQRDNANVSICADDTTLVGQWHQTEVRMCVQEMGLTPAQIATANLKAAQASFLKEEEKEELLEHLMTANGIYTIRG